MFRTTWATFVEEFLWAFELISGILLLTAIGMSWCVAITLFYHDIRQHREGELLRNKIEALERKYVLMGVRAS
jgi:hypothetical protein